NPCGWRGARRWKGESHGHIQPQSGRRESGKHRRASPGRDWPQPAPRTAPPGRRRERCGKCEEDSPGDHERDVCPKSVEVKLGAEACGNYCESLNFPSGHGESCGAAAACPGLEGGAARARVLRRVMICIHGRVPTTRLPLTANRNSLRALL